MIKFWFAKLFVDCVSPFVVITFFVGLMSLFIWIAGLADEIHRRRERRRERKEKKLKNEEQ